MPSRALASVLAFVGLFACGQTTREIAASTGGMTASSGGSGGGGDELFLDAGSSGPPAADAGGLCGNQIHQVTTTPPNVYFVFDTSGSMATPIAGGTRFSVVQAATSALVTTLRHVIRTGAAAFPFATQMDACAPGGEVFTLAFENPAGFNAATEGLPLGGGTPTAATLTALTPKLAALPGKTVVVLATDGGPNCNTSLACDASECMENIEGCVPPDTCCGASGNCCVPGGPAGPTNCVDHAAAVKSVANLWAAGIKVYVVGIPGSKTYAKVLADMALAGGAPQFTSPFYYDVEDLSMLGSVLLTIAGAEISCDFVVDDPPATPNFTNVYLDRKLVASDPTNGWTWTSTNVVTLHGMACAKLKAGVVAQVQIVSGCPTEVAN